MPQRNPLLQRLEHHSLTSQKILAWNAIRTLAQRELARRSLLAFVLMTMPSYEVGWVHKEICDILDAFIEACERQLGPRLIIELPPRIGKSELVSRKFPAFLLGRHPDWEVVCATYNQDLASDFGREVRSTFQDPIFAELFPQAGIRTDSNSIDFVKFTDKGSYTAVGIGGALTGRGAHALLIDDPVKNREDADSEIVREATWKWYQTVARTRISPGGGIICCQTRWHQEDLVGKILLQAAANPDGDQWMRYSFPAIATKDEKHRKTGEALHPERWPIEEYIKLRATLDPREWSALYQQNPTPAEGILFKRDWIHYAHPPKTINWYVTTDFAIGEKNTNDFTVILPFGVDENDTVYFDMPVRARMSSMDIVEKLCDTMANKRPQQIAIENVHISKTIGPYLRKRMQERHLYTTTWGYTASKDKVARSASLRGRMQQGKVYFHPMLKNLIEEEMLPFPAARFDDFVHAASVGMLMLDSMMHANGPPTPPPDPAPAWSYDWIQANIARSSGAATSHVPRHLNGKERKLTEKKQSWK